MFGFTSKSKKATAQQAAKDLEATTLALVSNTGRTLSQVLRADHAVHGMEPMSYEDSLELKAMGL